MAELFSSVLFRIALFLLLLEFLMSVSCVLITVLSFVLFLII